MKNGLMIMGIVLGLMVTALPALAQDEGASGEAVVSSQTTEVGNKICPVSGEKVGEMGEVIKYEYNGKIYNLCCSMCAKDFKKNPEKYSKIAEEEVQKNAESQAGDAEGSEK